jgi:sarcosine oxidase
VKVVIVGAGVLGAALAQRLARIGRDVTLVEQDKPGHPRAASDARSRILRVAHGPDARDTKSAWLARRLWLELERETGVRVYDEVGMAWFATAADSTWQGASSGLLAEHGVPAELLSPSEALRLFPGIRTDDLEQVLLEPHAGLLRPREAVRALVRDAIGAGAKLLRGRATPDGARVVVADRRLEADSIVWACGAWTPRLFPDFVPGLVIQQDVFYFAVPAAWATPGVPAWGEWHKSASGTGDFLGFGFKVGIDAPGPPLDPDERTRRPVREHEADARAYLATRFPGLASAPLTRTESCQTVILQPSLPAPVAVLGGEVRVVRDPEHGHVWLLGDGSGHAFKHAPAIAAELEALVTSDSYAKEAP